MAFAITIIQTKTKNSYLADNLGPMIFAGFDTSLGKLTGGSWESGLSSRAAARNSDTPFLRINRVGFRLVIVREESLSAMLAPSAFDIS